MSLLRSLVIQPDIIFYDEPTNNLDEQKTNLILDIIKLAINEKKQIILVSHDNEFVVKLNCLNIYLSDGVLCND